MKVRVDERAFASKEITGGAKSRFRFMVEGDAEPALAAIRAALASTLAIAPRAEVTVGLPAPRVKVADLVALVAFETGLAAARLTGDDRHAPVVRARDAVVLGAVDVLGMSATQVGRAIGDRDQTTIAAAIRRARERVMQDPAFKRLLARIERRFGEKD